MKDCNNKSILCRSNLDNCGLDLDKLSLCSIIYYLNKDILNKLYSIACADSKSFNTKEAIQYTAKHFLTEKINSEYWRLQCCYTLDPCGLGGVGIANPCDFDNCCPSECYPDCKPILPPIDPPGPGIPTIVKCGSLTIVDITNKKPPVECIPFTLTILK